MIFELKKPIYGAYYGIWDKWLNIADRKNLKIVVKTKEGTATFKSARELKNGARKMERYYKNPDVPMIFYGIEILPYIKARELRKKKEKKVAVNFFEIYKSLPEKQRLAIRKKIFSL